MQKITFVYQGNKITIRVAEDIKEADLINTIKEAVANFNRI